MQSLKEKTARGLFWGGISGGLQQILGALFGIILARILNAEDYGTVGLLAIFSGIAGSIQECGFTTALTNKKEIRHEDYNAVFWFSAFSSLFMYILLFFGAPFIAKFFHKPELVNLSRVVFLGFLFGGLGIAQNAYLFKNMMVKQKAQIDIISLAVSGITGISMALLGFGYWGLAVQSTLYIVSGTVLRWWYSGWRPTWNINFSPLKPLFGFSFKLFLTNVLNQINNNIFSVLLGKFYNVDAVGYYSQGQKWMIMGYTFIGGMLNGVAQPVLVQVTDNRERECLVFRKMLRFGAFVSFPLVLGLGFVGKEFIIIAVGEKWLPAVPFLQMFCIWGSVGYMWTLYTNLLMTHGYSGRYMWGMSLTGIIQLIVVAVMFRWGIFWMLGAYIVVYFMALLGWQFFARQLIGLRLWMVLKDILPYLFITLVSFGVAWFLLRSVENVYLLLFAKIGISAIVYVSALYLFDSVVFRESVAFLKKIRR